MTSNWVSSSTAGTLGISSLLTAFDDYSLNDKKCISFYFIPSYPKGSGWLRKLSGVLHKAVCGDTRLKISSCANVRFAQFSVTVITVVHAEEQNDDDDNNDNNDNDNNSYVFLLERM